MIDVEVRQTGKDIAKVYAALDKVGRRDLKKQIRTSLGDSTKPLRQDVQSAERTILPRAMAKYAKLPTQSLSLTTTGANVSWKQRRTKSDMKALDRGKLRHPLFGNRHRWYNQAIKPGMWSDTIKDGTPKVRSAFIDTMQQFVEKAVKQ